MCYIVNSLVEKMTGIRTLQILLHQQTSEANSSPFPSPRRFDHNLKLWVQLVMKLAVHNRAKRPS